MDIKSSALRRTTMRLIPLLMICYLFAYLDRVNVSFAALTMNADLGISATAYGLGAGMFFITYFVFELPSNLILERVGARVWIARIMISWGAVSGLTAFIPEIANLTGLSNLTVFYIVRLLLGAAEAGFFPGIVYYLTLWYPAENRARIAGFFMAAIPFSSVIGAPISGALLGMDGVMALKGWQWLFVLEAAPTILLAIVVFCFLTDRPKDAHWLPEAERNWLIKALDDEKSHIIRTTGHTTWAAATLNPRVIALSLVYFAFVVCLYGLSFFLPQIIKAFGLTNLETGFVTAIPYMIGVFAAVYWGRRSDRTNERRFHCAIALFLAAGGIGLSVMFSDPIPKMIAISISAFGLFGGLPVFWSLPSSFLTGSAAAAGIAMINSIGNLSGFVAPYAVGYLKDRTGSFDLGLLLLSLCGLIGVGIVLAVTRRTVEKSIVRSNSIS